MTFSFRLTLNGPAEDFRLVDTSIEDARMLQCVTSALGANVGAARAHSTLTGEVSYSLRFLSGGLPSCVAPVSEEQARKLGEASLKPLAPYRRNLRLERARRLDAGETCGFAFDVWGAEVWRGPAWRQVVPEKSGHKLAELLVQDDGTIFWKHDDDGSVMIRAAEVAARFGAEVEAMERVRALPEVRDACGRPGIPCDVTISGFHRAACSPQVHVSSECAWSVHISLLHEWMQRFATFYVREDGATFVSPSLWGGELLTLERWRCLSKNDYDEAKCPESTD